jgi:hypothetical protein
MSTIAARFDGALWRLGSPDAGPLPWRTLGASLLIAGPFYGAVMGSFALDRVERLLMVAYAAAKMPILLLGTCAVCLPGFFVLSSVLGLRRDFREAFGAILSGQAALALGLASLAPITRFIYESGADHRAALLFNGAMFALSTAGGQAVMVRRYRPLIRRDRAHRWMLWMWVGLYAFVGIQMGWTLRPFVGSPGVAVTFFRSEPFSNAYVTVFHLIAGR